jgi:plastocyanin
MRLRRAAIAAILCSAVLLALLTSSASSMADALVRGDPAPMMPIPGVRVAITAGGLDPARLSVTPGTEVTWYNTTAVTCTLQMPNHYWLFLPMVITDAPGDNHASAASERPAASATRPQTALKVGFSVILPPGGTFAYVFMLAGEYPYFLTNTSQFNGWLTVHPPTPTATPTATRILTPPPRPTRTLTPTFWPRPTRTLMPTLTATSVLTATDLPTDTSTPTTTDTPTPTATPTATPTDIRFARPPPGG